MRTLYQESRNVIENAKMMICAYMHGNRRTGKTTRLVEQLQSGDLVIAGTDAEAHHVYQMWAEVDREKNIRVKGHVPLKAPRIVSFRSDRSMHGLFEIVQNRARGDRPRRIFFTHECVANLVRRQMEDLEAILSQVESMSIEGEVHRLDGQRIFADTAAHISPADFLKD